LKAALTSTGQACRTAARETSRTSEPPQPATGALGPSAPSAATFPAGRGVAGIEGRIRGKNISLPVAWASVDPQHRWVMLTFLDRPVPEADFSCGGVQNLGEPYLRMDVLVRTSAGSGPYVGKTIPVLADCSFGRELNDWADHLHHAALTISKVDLAARVIEGTILEEDDSAGQIAGGFRATLCAPEGAPVKIEPSLPDLPVTPLTAQFGDRTLTFPPVLASVEAGLGEWLTWTIVFSTVGSATCEPADSFPYQEWYGEGMRTRIDRMPTGGFPVGYAFPADVEIHVASGSVAGAEWLTAPDCFGGAWYPANLLLTEIGRGSGTKLKGAIAIDRTCSFKAVTEGAGDLKVHFVAGGTFEATICPGMEEQLEPQLDGLRSWTTAILGVFTLDSSS